MEKVFRVCSFGLMGMRWLGCLQKVTYEKTFGSVFAPKKPKKKVHKEPRCARFTSLPIKYARECIALLSSRSWSWKEVEKKAFSEI